MDAPEQIWLVPEIEDQTGRDLWRHHGDVVRGVPVIPEVLETGPEARCEQCKSSQAPLYRLTDERHGIPVCRGCFEDSGWIRAVVTDKSALEDIDVAPPAGVEPL